MRLVQQLALRDAGLDPGAIGYVNGHGTATEHGDIAESRATAAVLRWMLHTPVIGMVNLIARTRVAPELVQDDFTPEAVEREVSRLMESSEAREAMKADLAKVRAKLGPGGAIERAADIFAAML